MPSPYAEGNWYKCNRSLARTKNSKKGKRNLSQPTTYFHATHSFTRGVFISTLLSQQDLQKKAEWDCRSAGSIYSWKTFVGNILQREKKKKRSDGRCSGLSLVLFSLSSACSQTQLVRSKNHKVCAVVPRCQEQWQKHIFLPRSHDRQVFMRDFWVQHAWPVS